MSGELSFFELGVGDAAKGQAFYGSLFGWELVPNEGGEGLLVRTRTVPGGMHGGDPGASPYVFLRVDDIEVAKARVVELGGSIDETDLDGDEGQVARFGRFVLCVDDQGSPFGLHQPEAGAE